MHEAIPRQGWAKKDILHHLEQKQSHSREWREGRAWGFFYYLDDAHRDLLQSAYQLFFDDNYINPLAFKGIRQLESEVTGMTAHALNAPPTATGMVTSGGNESLILAVHAARQRASHIRNPEIVMPVSAHAAFEKAADFLGIKIRKAPLDSSYRADPEAMRRLINRNTILLVGSAPSYPHGVLDPIEAIGELAVEHKIPFHVDACLGGFVLPWASQLGYALPPWDFRVAGVTSVSADVHKFGYGAKGASVLLYRHAEWLEYQFFVSTEWPGGIYATTTLAGSRPAGPIAAAWAAMKYLGEEGYLEKTRILLEGAARLREALKAIPGIVVLGDPCINVFSFTTVDNKPDCYVLADKLAEKGWLVNRLQAPAALHLLVLLQNLPHIDDFVADVQEALDYARENPRAAEEGGAAMYGLMARLPLRSLVARQVSSVLRQAYAPGANTDEHAASVHAVPRWQGVLNRLLRLWR